MKCTIVMDNLVSLIPKKPFISEHGFSLLIEHGERKILFDSGYSRAILHNLSLLGVHPAEIDSIVLSHGHYDHAGGLYYLLEQGQKKYPLYAHPDIFLERYSLKDGGREDIGIPYTKERLSSMGAEWHLDNKPTEIMPGLWLSGQIPRQNDYETGDKNLVAVCDCCDCTDAFADDIALYYVSSAGLVVISGCAHAGLVNIVEYGLEITKAGRLAGWIGGTHLGPAGQRQQDTTIDMLLKMRPDFIMAGHCTGFKVMAEMANRLGDIFLPSYVGRSVNL